MTASAASLGERRDIRQAVPSVGLADALVFLIPAVLAANVQLTGKLFLSELILLGAIPFLATQHRFMRISAASATVVVAGLLWLWAQVVTDLHRSTPFNDFSRGWLNILFTIIDFAAILMLIAGRQRRIILFTAGLAVGYMLEYRFNPSVFAEEYPWKFGIAIPVTLLIVLLGCHTAPIVRSVSWLFLFSAGTLNFVFGFRSLGGICFLAGTYLAAQAFSRRSASFRISLMRVMAFCLIGGFFAFLLVSGYGHAARDGFLGAPAAEKYRTESSGRFGVLLGGRPELFASSRAIIDSPFLGHGSWAKDPKYSNELISLLYRNGYQPDASLRSSIQHSRYLIPSHSYLLGSWVEAGFLGGLFWILVLTLSLKMLIVAFRTRPLLSPLFAFLGIELVWNVFFSPYGADQRILAMFTIAALLTSKDLPRKRLPTETPPLAELRRSRASRW